MNATITFRSDSLAGAYEDQLVAQVDDLPYYLRTLAAWGAAIIGIDYRD